MAGGSASIGGRAALAIRAVLQMASRHLHTAGACALTDAGSYGLTHSNPTEVDRGYESPHCNQQCVVMCMALNAHGVAEKLPPRLLIPMVGSELGTMVASILQHALRPLCAV
jgi:hypothetical protein